MTHSQCRYKGTMYKGLGLLLASSSSLAFMPANGLAQDGFTLEEIVVTAQRREERLSDVPISVSAYSQERLDVQGVRSIDDIARLAPGVNFTRADERNGLASSISIRGISSAAGASTTGIYINDTPIQIRNLGYSAFNTFPEVFDLERVEVLRGPQGTLFGAGSEGGTVRFITPGPSYSGMEVYGRSEIGFTQNGSSSYEAGAAMGVPIVENQVGLRVSGWYRRDGGWIDRVEWDRDTLEPNRVMDKDSNWQDSYVFKAALGFAPTDDLEITPSIYYQDLTLNDTLAFWESLSNPSQGEFNNGNALSAVSKDKFLLPALNINWNLGPASLISNTSYFDRDNLSINDYSAFEAGIWAQNPYFPEGFYAPTRQINKQKNWTQELRLESNDSDSRLNWVVGTFYWHAEQTAKQFVQDTFLPDLFFENTGIPFEAFFGQGLVDGLYTFVADPIEATDKQWAVFGQADFDITDELTVTAGLRYSNTKMKANADYEGPVVGPPVSDAGSQKEDPVTPKVGISYNIDDDNMVYATAAKGFRIGGYNPRVGLPCSGQLADLGLSEAPSLYESDSVWSYEVGAKNTVFGGRVRLDTSAYYVDWSNIQQQVALSSCGFTFVDNLGSATSKGFDLQIQAEPVNDLTLSLDVGYTNATFDETVLAGPAAPTNLVTEGDHISGPPWKGAVSAQYSFRVLDGRDAYARVDYQFQSSQSSLTPATNPANGAFNPDNVFTVPETHLVSLRTGVTLDGFNIAAFVKNLFNTKTVLSRTASSGAQAVLYRHTTFRPRTLGVTAIYRY